MRKPAILFISYYFHPSQEVGAKRPTATVKHLVDNGYDVTVLRALEYGCRGDDAEFGSDRVRIISVVVPRKLPTRAWIYLKSRFSSPSSANAEAPDGPADDAQTQVPAGTRRKTVMALLRRQFLALDTSFQGNKLWLTKILFHILRLRLSTRFDLVIASGPPFVGLVGGHYASRLFKAMLLLDFRDPWYLHGDKERKTEILGHPIATWENGFGQKCISRADVITVASPGIRRHCEEMFEVGDTRVELIRNGYDTTAIIDSAPPTGRLELLYAGSLYWNRNPFPFLETLREILSLPDVDPEAINLTMVGDCAEWEGIPLQPWIAAHDLSGSVRLLQAVEQGELRRIVGNSNVLVNFAQGQPRQIPAKSYEYLASGRDLIIVAEPESDVAELFREAGVGQTVSPDDISGLRNAILVLYGKYVENSGEHTSPVTDPSVYSRVAQTTRFNDIVQDLINT